MPSSPPRHTWRSSAAPPGGAGPTAATEEVCTTRSTFARRHSSSTVRVPWTLMRNRSSAAMRRFVVPATWKTRSTPRSARRTARRSVTSATTVSTSRPLSGSSREVARTVTRTSSPRSTRARATRDPTNPVAPVTRVVAIAGAGYPSAPWRPHRLRCPAMPRVAVVTDTTHYMPRALVEELDLHEVSLYVTFDGVTEREADLTDLDDFYRRLSDSSEMPSTSQPSVGDFLAVYEPLLEAGSDVVSIHLSGGISGTCAAAGQAREQLVERGVAPERIVVLDSATACAGLGMLVMAAVSAARAGASAVETADAAQATRGDLKVWFAVDTLEFLRRGGRVGGAQAWLGSTLKIKPILSIESEILPVERVRTAGRAFERLIEYLKARHDDGCDTFFIQHIHAPDQAQRLVERGMQIYGREPESVSEIGPVIGAHVGPGLLGVSGMRRELLYPRG